ncbi:MARVEL multi-domain protein [Pyrenophora tritici-repentis]|nr:hypothetical protein PtrV1_00611 [Pyrenophora tritici-repentis]KAG9377226.1 hypothetical protein A1F94_011629 [Pyrenophora tritici-repentis]KAI0570581.1 hypothetical protein Alg215_10970 [Pyrenophora tritici-repentis]KAI0590544.1 hypothetical protein Alg130_02159 [Pyrenophora tritici-repentis]KAI0613621.1 hypothetical protein TUN205_02131 [Pyrenophora tritici-repentis]
MLLAMGLKFLPSSTLRGEKATLGTSLRASLSATTIARLVLRLFQFVMALTVIGMYAVDLDRARKADKYVDSKWVWAVVCGSLGAVASLVFMLPFFKAWFFFVVDAVLFLCYLVAFGIFGKMFIGEDPEGNKGIQRMKNGVWVLLTNVVLWFITAIVGAVLFWKARKARTTHTGRAGMHV